MAQELQHRGHEVVVLSGGPPRSDLPPLSRYCYEGIAVVRLNPPPPRPPWRGGIAASYQRPELAPLFTEVLAAERPELVHAFHLRRLTLELVNVCRGHNLPMLVTLTDFWSCCPTGQLSLPDLQNCSGPEEGGANCARHLAGRIVQPLQSTPLTPWRWLMAVPWGLTDLRRRPQAMDQALAACQAVLVGSESMANIMGSNGFAHWPIKVCPHGVVQPVPFTATPQQSWNPSERRARIGFIGTLRPAKGAHLLLAALQSWAGPAVDLRLYGSPLDDPNYVDSLKRQASMLPAEVIPNWLGTFPPRELNAVLSELDLLVVPSLWIENSPLIVHQALAARLPVVAFDVEGIREQIQPGLTGVLIPLGDTGALGERLAELVRHPEQLELLAKAPRNIRTLKDYVNDLDEHHHEAITGASNRVV